MAIDDTDPRAREVQLAHLGSHLHAARRTESKQRRHPELRAAEVRRIVLGRMWGQALADKVYDKIR